ncbi:DNA-binding GntR family transcriptional regulator [Devosia sp. UYZn731]|uniref:GntR family transcriptional regulator n=1 Tax=Devosia sp. UYZn731 TaxID=3156345 RepID=UPI0033993038
MARRALSSSRTRPLAKAIEADAEPIEGGDDVTDRICSTLAAAIGNGALKPGTKILEDAIAEHFGVSRTVVRGALGILQRDHLLERKRNRGTFVAEPSIEEATQLFEARRTLEQATIERVVERATEADLDQLEALNEEEKRLYDVDGSAAGHGLSGRFHNELARLGGNDVLTDLFNNVTARLSLVMVLYEEEKRADWGADHHHDIVAAIRKRDVKLAQTLMNEHLADIESRVRLTQSQGDRHTFVSVLETFSAK